VKITPQSLTISQLLGQTNERYLIPPYQRRYSWLERQIRELIEDVSMIEANDSHLLGSIVCLTGGHVANLNELEVVDGQQRLTTISILLSCLKERFLEEGASESSKVSDIEKLLEAKSISGQVVEKIKLESIDAKDYAALLNNDVDVTNQCLKNAFDIVRAWTQEMPLEKLKNFWYHLVNQSFVIRLDVSNAKDAFKLFETINNRGLRLSQTDIVKNFLLGNAARFGPTHLTSARSSWAKLVVNLDGTNSDAFFRYYLTAVTTKRVTASKVIAQFKWMFHFGVKEAKNLPEQQLYVDLEDSVDEDVDQDGEEKFEAPKTEQEVENIKKPVSFKKFMDVLISYSKVYGELVRADTGNTQIDRHLKNLKMIKATQAYGFLMHLRVNQCADKDLRSVLKLTENFILRRHVCKERTNETESLFASMCAIDPAAPIPSTKTYYKDLCPSDEKFEEEFSSTTFPSNLIDRARYCLEKFELAKIGSYTELSVLGGEDVHVEHIIPQKIKSKANKDEVGDWVKYLGEASETKHRKYVSRIGNLTLFAGELNIAASNNPFQRKKSSYRESGIKLTKEIAAMPHFKFAQVDKRSLELASIAVGLWPKS
jgi:Protein of unknown function DUF262/Protein of unknown function (DUF1524)